MKIKPPSRSVLDPERFHDCADALEPYVYALLRMVDYQHANSAQPNFRQVREAARAAGWDDVAISAAIDYLTAAFAMAGEPVRAADDARRLRREPSDE
jgi:2,4-dienoyl-CoA reductase-like NADH-dependent reductase (Old Yellow Enzyme family)